MKDHDIHYTIKFSDFVTIESESIDEARDIFKEWLETNLDFIIERSMETFKVIESDNITINQILKVK